MPPPLYGGIERVVDLLARGLAARGHDVTLFAHPDSRTAGTLVPWPGRTSRSRADTARNAVTLARHVVGQGFDIVHSFARIASLVPILPLALPKLMTYQRPITPRSVRMGHRLSRGTLAFSAVSRCMTAGTEDTGRWFMVPNGVPGDRFAFVAAVPGGAPLVFLGRIERIKGPHLAAEIARRSGHRLVIAGNIAPGAEAFFEAELAPLIDGDRIACVGPVDDARKNALLGGAKALLMPVLWDEPFGIVMAEAMACGTPVLGLDRGAVPEVVEHGVTGFVAGTVDALVEAAGRLDRLDRAACRARMETFYSADAVVDGYLGVYRTLIAR